MRSCVFSRFVPGAEDSEDNPCREIGWHKPNEGRVSPLTFPKSGRSAEEMRLFSPAVLNARNSFLWYFLCFSVRQIDAFA
jgi:hypothetical protein